MVNKRTKKKNNHKKRGQGNKPLSITRVDGKKPTTMSQYGGETPTIVSHVGKKLTNSNNSKNDVIREKPKKVGGKLKFSFEICTGDHLTHDLLALLIINK